MPYIVDNGDVHQDGSIYRLGDEVPGEKGSLADVEAVGAVKWVEPEPEPEQETPDGPVEPGADESVEPEPDVALEPEAAPAKKRGGRR